MPAIDNQLFIADDELRFTTARSGGPGGQHVNKTESKVILHFTVDTSPSLNQRQKIKLYEHLGNRINGEGVLRVSAESSRSQHRNRETAIERFIDLIRESLREEPERKKTKMPRSAKRKRLEHKKQRSEVKRRRRTPHMYD
ncbi:MAG: alternative ribosome rescue aminoacyl-tRNA hydrolase ArfB [Acidobacteriota bacterium]